MVLRCRSPAPSPAPIADGGCGDCARRRPQRPESSGDARYYLLEAYKHLKPILLAGDARQLTSVLQVPTQGEEGIVTDALDTPAADKLLALMTAHRVWSRSPKIAAIPA
jgi:hypothetical protein